MYFLLHYIYLIILVTLQIQIIKTQHKCYNITTIINNDFKYIYFISNLTEKGQILISQKNSEYQIP